MQEITPELFKKLLDFAYDAYQNKSKKDKTRQEGKTPFITHPFFAASLLLADQRIPWEDRYYGYQILVLHDVLEDTTAGLPEWLDTKVIEGVKDLSFPNNPSIEEELEIFKKKGGFIELLALCDKISNVYEEHVSEYHRKEWKKVCEKLIQEVKRDYGDIRIVEISETVLANTNW
jgi:(p)ppGpp synthase/HD superfamily hydrolase